jgi:hypothetical protein
MLSPFPGMDPMIESLKKWSRFHTTFLVAMADALVPRVRPAYVVEAEEYVFLCDDADERIGTIRPDVHVLDAGHGWREYAGAATASATQEIVRTIVTEEPIEQHYLTIRDIEDRQIVTVIELLSPTNKDGSEGSREYRHKRANVCRSEAHLVELDLLRGGQRLPTTEPLPPGDFYAFLTRKWQSPHVVVYPWTLRDRLPTIPIPLKDGDPDVPLDLQPIFDGVYERAGYDYSLKYDRPLTPTLSEADQAWAAEILASRQSPAWMKKQEATP